MKRDDKVEQKQIVLAPSVLESTNSASRLLVIKSDDDIEASVQSIRIPQESDTKIRIISAKLKSSLFIVVHLFFVVGTGSGWSTGQGCLAVLAGLGGQVVWVLVPSHNAPPAARVLPSSDRRLKPPLLRPPVGVLPALHQYHQGVEPEEDDDGDDDALKDDPDVDVVGASH